MHFVIIKVLDDLHQHQLRIIFGLLFRTYNYNLKYCDYYKKNWCSLINSEDQFNMKNSKNKEAMEKLIVIIWKMITNEMQEYLIHTLKVIEPLFLIFIKFSRYQIRLLLSPKLLEFFAGEGELKKSKSDERIYVFVAGSCF